MRLRNFRQKVGVIALAGFLASALVLPGNVLGQTPKGDAVIAGTLIEDTDNDGTLNAGDSKGMALVTLMQRDEAGGYFCISYQLAEGSFRFENLKVADYEIEVWWSPGFLDYDFSPDRGAAVVFTGSAADIADGIETYFLRLKPNTSAVAPFPVMTGSGPFGTVSCDQEEVRPPDPGPSRAGAVIVPPDTGSAGLRPTS